MELTAAVALAEQLVAHHGLAGWTVVLDNAKRRAGVCHFGPRRIGLSAPLTVLHDEATVRDTILHEIAHALAGPRHRHDARWRLIARRIGCSGERCVDEDAPTVAAAWVGVCPVGHTVDRHRRPERVTTCSRCDRRFDLAHLLTWTHHGRPGEMHPNYLAELAGLREGRSMLLLPRGARVRITGPGELAGRVGRVLKRGRTSYHLRVGRELVRVPFAWVEPASGVSLQLRAGQLDRLGGEDVVDGQS